MLSASSAQIFADSVHDMIRVGHVLELAGHGEARSPSADDQDLVMGHGTGMERGGPGNGEGEMSRSLRLPAPWNQTEGIGNRSRAMFLKVRHNDDASLVEVLNVKQLFNPFDTRVQARLHGGEEMQDP